MYYISKDRLDDLLLDALNKAFNAFKRHGDKTDLLIGVNREGKIDVVDLDFDAPTPAMYHGYKWFATVGGENEIAIVANHYADFGSDYYDMDEKELENALSSFRGDHFDDHIFNAVWENVSWGLEQFLRLQDIIEVV